MKKLLLFAAMSSCLVAVQATTILIPVDYPTIQQGINNAVNGDTILVNPGTYLENINFNGKNITVASLYLLTNDTTDIDSTIISCSPTANLEKSIVTFENGETSAAQLIGLTLRNGGGNYRLLGSDFVFYGGGVYCNSASPALSHLVIKNNSAECGGGIFLYNSSSIVDHCNIRNNFCNSVALDAPNAGAAIAIWNCQCTIQNTRITENFAGYAGGGIYTLTSDCHVVNCLITSNHSQVIGSAFYVDSWSHLEISNCTVSNNLCDDGSGLEVESMIYCLDSAEVHINNSIVYGNQPTTIICQFNYSRNTVSVFHSDFEGGIDSIYTNNNGSNVTINWLSGNINTDPLFVNTSQSDFHLQSFSSCINAGDTTGVAGIPPFDLDNNNRFYGVIDMGCYEFQGTTGIEQVLNTETFQLYPNPANEFVVLNWENPNEDATITMYDASGALEISAVKSTGTNQIRIQVDNLASGVYFIQVTTGGKSVSQKIVVHH